MIRRRSLRSIWPTVAACRRALFLSSAVLGVVSGSLSCANDAQWVRQATYPPQFRYISDEEMASVMWRLAGRVHELERHLGDQLKREGEHSPPDVTALLASLARIEKEARRLDSQGRASNHPYLQPKLRDFLAIVERAKLDLQRDPPHFATVDEVWRACSECHESS